jgi:hypothetical protein
LESTGDPALDALFQSALAEKVAKPPVPDYVAVSDEPVKPVGLQNSGIKVEGNEVLVPHMEPGELARNQPSRGKGMVPIKAPVGVSIENFYTLLSNAYALYVTEGKYDNETLQRRTGFTETLIAKVIETPDFRRALRLRGVEPAATGLTTEQDYAIMVLTDPSDGKTLSQKLKVLGISYAKYQGWLKNPVFKSHIDRVTESILANNADALTQLERAASEGDMAAIKFKLELNQRYDPNKQQNIDAMALMSMLFQIVATHVRDEAALEGIGTDLQRLAQDLKLTPQIGS